MLGARKGQGTESVIHGTEGSPKIVERTVGDGHVDGDGTGAKSE